MSVTDDDRPSSTVPETPCSVAVACQKCQYVVSVLLLTATEERWCRRLCDSGHGTGGSADTAWCGHDCLSYGLAATRPYPPRVWQYWRSLWNAGTIRRLEMINILIVMKVKGSYIHYFHPSTLGKWSTGLPGRSKALTCVGWQVTLCAPVKQVMFRTLRWSPWKAIHIYLLKDALSVNSSHWSMDWAIKLFLSDVWQRTWLSSSIA